MIEDDTGNPFFELRLTSSFPSGANSKIVQPGETGFALELPGILPEWMTKLQERGCVVYP